MVSSFCSFQDIKEIFPSLLADILAIFGTEVKSTAVVSVSLRTSYLRICSTCLRGFKAFWEIVAWWWWWWLRLAETLMWYHLLLYRSPWQPPDAEVMCNEGKEQRSAFRALISACRVRGGDQLAFLLCGWQQPLYDLFVLRCSLTNHILQGGRRLGTLGHRGMGIA